MPNYVADSLSGAAVRTQKMVDDFKKTDAGVKVSSSTNKAIESVYSMLDLLLTKSEALVDRVLPPVEVASTSTEGQKVKATTAPSCSSKSGAETCQVRRAMNLVSLVGSRVSERVNLVVVAPVRDQAKHYSDMACGLCTKYYDSIVGALSSCYESVTSRLTYLYDNMPYKQLIIEDVQAWSAKVVQIWNTLKATFDDVFSEDNKQAAKETFNKQTEAAKETLTKQTAAARDSFNKGTEAAKDSFNKGTEAAKDSFSKGTEAVKGYASEAKNTAMKYYDGAGQKVQH